MPQERQFTWRVACGNEDGTSTREFTAVTGSWTSSDSPTVCPSDSQLPIRGTNLVHASNVLTTDESATLPESAKEHEHLTVVATAPGITITLPNAARPLNAPVPNKVTIIARSNSVSRATPVTIAARTAVGDTVHGSSNIQLHRADTSVTLVTDLVNAWRIE